MKIVYLNPSGQLGGAERMLLDIFASVRAAEPQWSLHLIASNEGPLVSKAKELGVSTTIVSFPPELAYVGDAGAGGPAGNHLTQLDLLFKLLLAGPATMSYIKQLRRIVGTLAPDVIHTNGFKMHVLGIWARPRQTRIIWHIHDYVRSRPVMVRLLRHQSLECAMVIANSKSVAEDVKAVCGERLDVHTIYNGIDLNRFTPIGPILNLDALSGLLPAAQGIVKVGLLATMARWKGHETFIRAMSLIPSSLPIRGYIVSGAIYQTVGSQHSLEELKSLAAKMYLSDRVGFTGYVEKPDEAMRALDIIVHASTRPEPFGLVIAEGMACGRAVIASQAGGASELITAEKDALVHSPGDAEMLASCIMRLATDSDLRARLGQAGRNTAERRFNRARLATELIPLYSELASSRN